MSNTSATGGYLTEASTTLSLTAMENAWHDAIAGITGLDNTLVRPVRQVQPTRQPAHPVNWCAFDIERATSDEWASYEHVSADDGSDLIIDHDVYTILAVVYGPDADELAGILRRGLYVWQNRAALRAVGIAVQRIAAPVSVPELADSLWRQRVDLEVQFAVERRGSYAVLNLLRSTGDILGDDGTAVAFDTEEVKPHG